MYKNYISADGNVRNDEQEIDFDEDSNELQFAQVDEKKSGNFPQEERCKGGHDAQTGLQDNNKTLLEIPPAPQKVFKSSVVIIPPDTCWDQIQVIREKYDKSFVRWMPHINMLYPFIVDEGSNFEEATEKLTAGLANVEPFKVVFSKDSFGYFRHKKDCTLWLKPLEQEPIEISVEGESETKKSQAEQLTCSSGVAAADGPAGDKLSKSDLKKLKKRERKKQEAEMRNKEVSSAFRFHPGVIDLQTTLEGVFPFCNDLSGISGGGFKPHLSVGQFTPREVDSFMNEFKDKWESIEFSASEVCLISRENFDDPFHVRRRIPFGKK